MASYNTRLFVSYLSYQKELAFSDKNKLKRKLYNALSADSPQDLNVSTRSGLSSLAMPLV